MIRGVVIVILLVIKMVFAAFAQSPLPKEKQWFAQDKYGVFIHWCLNDPLKELFRANPKEYAAQARLSAKSFTADAYQPDEWAAMFKEWGAKYAVLTTKHHVGFALFDMPRSKFTAKKSSPAKRDLLTAYCVAMRKAGIKVGLYYSLPDRTHPYYASLKFKEDGKTVDSTASDFKQWNAYVDDMLAEISHLCRNYGQIDLFWFDGDWERSADQWRSFQIMDTVKKYQPHAVVNNRLRHQSLGDYATPEMVIPLKAPTHYPAWELCTTLGYNWAGPDANKHLKAPDELAHILMHTLGLGGNLLLNVSPDMRGIISKEQQEKMKMLGEWINTNSAAIYGTEKGLPLGHYDGASTRKGNKLYLYVAPGNNGKITLKNVAGNITRARVLSTGEELEHTTLRDYHEEKPDAKNWKYIHLKPQNDPIGVIVEVEWTSAGWRVD
jgi:alpha-L-fucosidase